MKHQRFFRMAAFIGAGMFALAPFPSAAAGPLAGEGMDTFEHSVPLQDTELDKLRGGFIDVSGAKIDFELVQRTIIDGVTRNEFSLSTESVSKLSELNQTIIQVGDSNKLGLINDLVDIPNLLTIVQNTKDNTLIQNLNALDITLQNFGEIQSNAALSAALTLNPADGIR